MIPFLKQVVRKYFEADKLGNSCFVFPNRRAMLFFQKYLAEQQKTVGNQPLIAPAMYTVNDFFYMLADVFATDRISLLLELYDCYKQLNPKAESLDEFVFWGDIILADFNDVDKYLANPHALFANVSDFKQLQDTFSYLTDTQRKAIEAFVSHFNDRSGRLTVDISSDNPDVKARFLQIWNILGPLYTLYNETLANKEMAYEGMVYRAVAKLLEQKPVVDLLSVKFPDTERFVFVGLNALNECEKLLMRRMRDAGIAEFCWDYSGKMIQDKRNKSSFFMSSNVKDFPQVYKWDEDEVQIPEINVLAVPSGIAQVKLLPQILEDARNSAIVLPDENLLIPLLNSIPPEITDINVTMGYGMSSSALYTLMSDISVLQLHARERQGEYFFYHKNVQAVFSNGIFRNIVGEEGMEIISAVKSAAKIYVSEADFKGHWLTELIFKLVIKELKSTDSAQIKAFAEYQKELLGKLAAAMQKNGDMTVELEFAKAYYCGINRLIAHDLSILPLTYIRLLEQILGSVSVPFKGEPLKGLQIMGPLETRALDFENLILFSANEGLFPKRSVSSSFVPAELRKGFNLPTYEYQDAVWAYYFYRMISRAERVWLIYDSRTEGLKSGEESRYIKQLQYHFRLPVKRWTISSQTRTCEPESAISKTAGDVAKIKEKYLSATSIQAYLACPVQFYYKVVKELSADNEVSEALDAGMLGNVYHNLMWALYSGEEAMREDFVTDKTLPGSGVSEPLKKISIDYIDSWLCRKKDIRAKADSLICEELNVPEISGRNLVVADVIVEYVLKTLQRDRELLSQHKQDAFNIIGLEQKFRGELSGFRFVGYIDRLDSFAEAEVRVNDYKTGKVLEEDMVYCDEQAERVADAVFGNDNKKRPKIALQFFIYDMLLKQNGVKGLIYNSVYQTSKLFNTPVECVPLNESFYAFMEKKLGTLLAEIEDLNTPFVRTDDADTCNYCDFKTICGR